MNRIPVFMCYAILVREMYRGNVTAEDLSRGLFYLDYTRDDIFGEANAERVEDLIFMLRSELVKARAIHEQIKAAIIAGEQAKPVRVDWQSSETDPVKRIAAFRGFLKKHGITGMKRVTRDSFFTYPCLAKLLRDAPVNIVGFSD